jgi:hypothetical protein
VTTYPFRWQNIRSEETLLEDLGIGAERFPSKVDVALSGLEVRMADGARQRPPLA